MAKCRGGKKIAQQAIARRADGVLPRNWEHRWLQSYFVQFAIRHLPTRANSIQREWPHYIQLDHQLHTYRQRDGVTSRQCWHWYWKL